MLTVLLGSIDVNTRRCIGIMASDLALAFFPVVVAVVSMGPSVVPVLVTPYVVREVGTAAPEGEGVRLVVVISVAATTPTVPVATSTAVVSAAIITAMVCCFPSVVAGLLSVPVAFVA